MLWLVINWPNRHKIGRKKLNIKNERPIFCNHKIDPIGSYFYVFFYQKILIFRRDN